MASAAQPSPRPSTPTGLGRFSVPSDNTCQPCRQPSPLTYGPEVMKSFMQFTSAIEFRLLLLSTFQKPSMPLIWALTKVVDK